MTHTCTQPLLLLDVDGPLNPFAARWRLRPRGYATHRFKPADWIARHGPVPEEKVAFLRVWLKAEHGAQLTALPYELVWATAWRHGANTHIGPVLGLPVLPVLDWPSLFQPELDGLHWKTRQIVEWAQGRPFAWVDDGITQKEKRFVTAHHDGPSLLHWVDPRRGLRAKDFAALSEWAKHLPGTAG
ncbi:MAG TPA: HAD domain-containing protein [Streptomyces sp.]|jgi:hypothetical protein|nr:HAD domain-containing protein [Streptomyces sp.]